MPGSGTGGGWRSPSGWSLPSSSSSSSSASPRARSPCSPTPVTWPPTWWPSAPRSWPPGSRHDPTRPGGAPTAPTGRRSSPPAWPSSSCSASSAYVVLEAIGRIGRRRPSVAAGPMLVVGGLGLVVNLIALLLLRGGAGSPQRQGRLPRGRRRHRRLGRRDRWPAGWSPDRRRGLGHRRRRSRSASSSPCARSLLGRQVLAVLGQHVPAGMEVDEVIAAPRGLDGRRRRARPPRVDADLGHARRDRPPRRGRGREPQQVLDEARRVLRDQHDIAHATLQVESEASRECHELDW